MNLVIINNKYEMDRTYIIENRILKIIDGEPYLKLEEQKIDLSENVPKKHSKKSKFNSYDSNDKGMNNKLSDSQARTMIEEYESGNRTVHEIVKDYGISQPTFYNYKKKFKKSNLMDKSEDSKDDEVLLSSEPRKAKLFECLSCAYEFKSILPVPRCPDCRGKTREVEE